MSALAMMSSLQKQFWENNYLCLLLTNLIMMKKMITTLIFLMFWQLLAAPPSGMIDIVIPKAIKVHDPILHAFMEVESNFRTGIINKLGYTGILQIGAEMTDEANRINELSGNPERFKFPECALDSLQSVQIWYIVQDWHNPTYDLRRAAQIWNPLSSINYYLKIKKAL